METFKDTQEMARFEAWATPLTSAALALASWIPEVDTAALIQFVDSPMVQLAWLEFEKDVWLQIPDTRNATGPVQMPYRRCIKMKEWEAAVILFKNDPERSGRKLHWLESHAGAKDNWQLEDHIAWFMLRIHIWATTKVKDLPIRPYLLDVDQRPQILAGALAACIRVHGQGKFPEPPKDSWNHERAEFHPGWLPMFQEWRARHDTRDPEAPRRLIYLTRKTGAAYQEKDLQSDALWFQLFIQRAKAGFDTGVFEGEGDWEWRSDAGFFAPPS
ncbi:hypothetical protein F4779DRAFT_561382 [Xylariaceae sp. FL0662B]|nr:hypothetical protein F4779DRAFT_561382 [Xylariaceae sp. FL0662B]